MFKIPHGLPRKVGSTWQGSWANSAAYEGPAVPHSQLPALGMLPDLQALTQR